VEEAHLRNSLTFRIGNNGSFIGALFSNVVRVDLKVCGVAHGTLFCIGYDAVSSGAEYGLPCCIADNASFFEGEQEVEGSCPDTSVEILFTGRVNIEILGELLAILLKEVIDHIGMDAHGISV